MTVASSGIPAAKASDNAAGAWLPISDWNRCASLAGPGQIAEIGNAEGLSLFTACSADLPSAPFDWTSPPSRFRLIAEPQPTHSAPLPAPNG